MIARTHFARGRTHARVLVTLLLGLVLSAAVAGAQTFSQLPTFDGADGGSLSESMLAVGPDKILEITPQWVQFYSKDPSHTLLSSTHINTFFGELIPGDPVAYYDVLRDRYLLVVQGLGAHVLLWISKTGLDPTDPNNWWKYDFEDPVSRDYPGLGVSDDKLVVRWYAPGATGVSNRIHVLDRVKAYDNLYAPGEPISVSIDLGEGNYKPCRNVDGGNDIHLVSGGGSGITYRTITGPPDAPVLSDSTHIFVDTNRLFPFSGGDQPDTSAFQSCEPRRLGDRSGAPPPAVYMRNGGIAMAWSENHDYEDGGPLTSAIRCVRFRVSDLAITDDFVVGRPGMFYTYGSIYEDMNGTLFVGYDRFSANEWPSCYMVARRGSYQSPEYLVRAGSASYVRCRDLSRPPENCALSPAVWGDYTSMVIDETASTSSSTTAYYVGEWTPTSHRSGTAIGTLRATYGESGIAGTVRSDGGGQPAAVAGVPVALTQGGATLDSTTTSATGTFNFGLLPAGTYVVRMALDPAVAQSATAGGGGTVLSPSEIQIVVAETELSLGSEFIITEQPAPVIDALSVTTVNVVDPDFDLVVSGQGFQPYSVVRFNGRDKVTTFDAGTGQLTARILHYDIARSGDHAVTVYTPAAPGSGISAPHTLTSYPRYVVSASFAPRMTACAGGDADSVWGTVVIKSEPLCNIDATNPIADLSLYAAGLHVWDVTEVFPGFPIFEIPAVATYDPGTGEATIQVIAGKISGCNHPDTTFAQFRIQNTSGFDVTVFTPDIDVRSFDLSRLVHGAVDRFDTDALGALLGGTERCGDFNGDGIVNASDLAVFASHTGHHAQARQLTQPNGGEMYTRNQGSGPTIPIRWSAGEGDSATVLLNLIDGSSVIPIASNVTDDGAYDWTDTCSPPISQNYRFEVVHTAGVYTQGDFTLGSDQSDGTVTINGTCSGGGGGCPFADTFTGGQWVEENSILGRSAAGELQKDLYRLTASPDVLDGNVVRLRLREVEREQTRLASARLIAVDRAPNEIAHVIDGRIVTGTFEPAWRIRTASGEDLTQDLTDPAGRGYTGSPGDVLFVELFPESGPAERMPTDDFGGLVLVTKGKEINDPGTSAREGLAYDTAVIERTGITIESATTSGAATVHGRIYPREHPAHMGVSSPRVVHVRFVGEHHIREVGWMRVNAEAPSMREVAPLIARHSGLGEVQEALTASNREVVLAPGEIVELEYQVPESKAGAVRDYFLATRGVYTSVGSTPPVSGPPIPAQIQFGSVHPNPALEVASVRFGLPTRSNVRLAVFDAQGRLVRKLGDRVFDAGWHDLRWDLRDGAGKTVPYGVYFWRMEVGERQMERKVIVVG